MLDDVIVATSVLVIVWFEIMDTDELIVVLTILLTRISDSVYIKIVELPVGIPELSSTITSYIEFLFNVKFCP